MPEPLYDVHDDEPLADDIPPDPNICPNCESPDIRRFPRFAFAAVGIGLVLAFDWTMSHAITEVAGIGIGIVVLMAILLDRWWCRDCGHGWK
jgi:hypothetical protein